MSEITKIEINDVGYNLRDGDAVNSARYNSTNTTIEFLNSEGVVVAYIDATLFVKDGMVSDVKVENGNLVVVFNTDSGKQPIIIPLTNIFDPSNYYDKQQTDALLGGKQNTINDLQAIRSGANAGSTAYQKPNTGIPSTDMSQAVQTSLRKADSSIQQHQDISGKADKVSNATSGNVAALDANGNLTDGGVAANRIVVSTSVRTVVLLTQAQYDALTTKDANTEYNIIESV